MYLQHPPNVNGLIEHVFTISKFALGWLMAVAYFVGFFLCLFLPNIITIFGERKVGLACIVINLFGHILSAFTPSVYMLYFSYSICISSPLLALILLNHIIILENFTKKRTTANAMYCCGYSIGAFLWPPIYRTLLDKYSWRGAFLMEGAIQFHIAICVLLETHNPIRKTPEPKESKEEHNQAVLDVLEMEVTRDMEITTSFTQSKETNGSPFKVILFLFALFLFYCGDCFGEFMIAVRLAYVGLNKTQITIILSASGITGIIRILPAWIIDKLNIRTLWASGVLALCLGTLVLISLLFTNFGTMLFFFIMFAFFKCKSINTESLKGGFQLPASFISVHVPCSFFTFVSSKNLKFFSPSRLELSAPYFIVLW